jgi:two-component system, OmpR family, sensor kinase
VTAVTRIRSSLGRRLRTVRDHRRSLRVRLLAALLGTSIAVFTAVDITTLNAIRSFLMQRVDNSLARAQRVAEKRIGKSSPGSSLQSGLTPGRYYVGLAASDGTLRPLLLDPITTDNPPRLPTDLSHVSAHPRTASAVRGGAPYRIVVAAAQGGQGYLVVGLSLEEYGTTVGHITRDLIAGTLGAFVVLAAAGWALTRRGLRLLERIADRADTVTGGDLSTRMDVTEATSEVGRLSTALNSMLDRIEHSVSERDAAEAHIRQFMADASHELRTPLTTVRAYSELYEQGALDDTAAVDEAMRRISGEAARMSELVSQLLTLARFDVAPASARCRLDLARLVREAAGDARAVEPMRRITLHAGEGPAWVEGDRAQLAMVITNLFANVRVHAGAAAEVTVTIERHDGRHVLEIADTGPGVPADALAHLFDRFYRAAPSTQRGSGLGLAIVAAIAQAHGGRVTAFAARPSGLRIRVELPAAAGAPEEITAPTRRHGSAVTPVSSCSPLDTAHSVSSGTNASTMA